MSNTCGLLHHDLTGSIIGAFFDVYNELGAGFRELVYEGALTRHLESLGFRTQRQPTIVVRFREHPIGNFRGDILVQDLVLLELKAVETLESAHEVQLLNCLRATSIEVGILLNFGPKPQFKRLIYTNDQKRSRRSR
jgi:GxxExxY protein